MVLRADSSAQLLEDSLMCARRMRQRVDETCARILRSEQRLSDSVTRLLEVDQVRFDLEPRHTRSGP